MNSPFAETLAQASSDHAPAPGGSTRTDSAARAAARRTRNTADAEKWDSTITAAHQMAFTWLRNDENTPFGLVSCYVNGAPSALIVAAKPDHDVRKVEIMPLFVALCDGMRVTDPDGCVIFESAGVA